MPTKMASQVRTQPQTVAPEQSSARLVNSPLMVGPDDDDKTASQAHHRRQTVAPEQTPASDHHHVILPLTIGPEDDDDDASPKNDHNDGKQEEACCPIVMINSLPFFSEQAAQDPYQIVRGFFTLMLLGTLIGILVPPNQSLPTPFYRTLSSIIGYTYILCWSVSLYPQVYYNYTRRTTTGLSSEYVLWNVLGFACYSIYTAAFYWNETVRNIYKERNNGGEVTVQGNDVIFTVHLWFLSSLMWGQIVYYDGYNRWVTDVSTCNRWLLVMSTGLCLVYPMLLLFVKSFGFTWFDYLYLLSYIKVWTTLIKFVPQMVLNTRRKSTVGLSIWRVLLDLMGGILSTVQLFGDAADFGDWRQGVLGNPAKLGLGCVSMVFDIIFVLQIYVFYPIFSGNEQQQQQSQSSKDLSPLIGFT